MVISGRLISTPLFNLLLVERYILCSWIVIAWRTCHRRSVCRVCTLLHNPLLTSYLSNNLGVFKSYESSRKINMPLKRFEVKWKTVCDAENNFCKYEKTTKSKAKLAERTKLCQLKIRNVTKLTGDKTQGNENQCQRVLSEIEATVPILTGCQE